MSLPAYRNDVLNALVATDGLPGLDAENAVYIIRRRTNSLGKDPIWTGELDAEDVIRNSKDARKTFVRGQSSDGWDYQKPQPWKSINGTQSFWDHDPTSQNASSRFNRSNSVSQAQFNSPQFNSVQQKLTPTPMSSQFGSSHPSEPLNWPGQPSQRYSTSQNFLPQNDPRSGGSSLSPAQGYSPSDAYTQSPLKPVPDDMYSNPSDPDSSEISDGRDISLTEDRRIIRIPIRLGPDERVEIKKEDIVLNDGDIVFIESRDAEVFFTGGLLGGGQYTLPRDYDLDILQAISMAGSRTGGAGAARQIGGVSALNGDVTISPSTAVIIRKLPEGGEVPIKIDLLRARSEPSERIYIQPGDYIYLQYTPVEAVAAFIDRHLLEGALFGILSTRVNQN